MFKKLNHAREKVQGTPKMAVNVVGRAVAGVAETTTRAVKGATRTLVTDPLAKVGSGVSQLDIRQKIWSPKRQSTRTATPSQAEKVTKEAELSFLLTELARNFLFSDLDSDRLAALTQEFERISVQQGETIISQGEPGDYFYVLYEGTVLYKKGDKVVGTSSDQEGAPKYFGDLALLHSSPRAASVVTQTDCILFRLGQAGFRRTVALTQGQHREEQKMDIVKCVPVLKDLDGPCLNNLVSAMTTMYLKQGEVICRPNEQLQYFFIVQSGKVGASEIVFGGASYEDLVIGPEEYHKSFGWLALIQNQPLSALVTALTDVTLLTIAADTFRNVVGRRDDVWGKLELTQQLKAVAVFRDSKLEDEQFESLADLFETKYFGRSKVLVKEGRLIDASINFIRKGSVEIESTCDSYKKTLEVGGYFGQDWMLADQNKDVVDNVSPQIESKFTATASPGTEIQTLFLEDARKVVNTALLGLGKPVEVTGLDKTIQVEDIKRHKMLGEGSFGQVWLTSYTPPGSDSKNTKIFALKVQSKHQLIESGQAEGVIDEANILMRLRSPFIIRLYNIFQDKQRVYMLTSLLQGGELEAVMGDKAMEVEDARFYAAGILEGLSYMHRRHIIHRDLKPENVLINSEGYPVLIDLGFGAYASLIHFAASRLFDSTYQLPFPYSLIAAKYVPDKTYTFCGTPLYVAPEVIQYRGHDKGADYWAWACIVFEMVSAKYPFYVNGMEQLELFEKVCQGEFKLYGFMSAEVKLLFVHLFVPNPLMRLGSRPNGWNDLYALSFFNGFDFESLRRQKLAAPWVPNVGNPLDASNFSNFYYFEDKMSADYAELSESQQQMFNAFGEMRI